MINWVDIKEAAPPEGEPVLFQELFSDSYHVGYWSEEENAMLEFPDGNEGYKWSVRKWYDPEDVQELEENIRNS